MQPIPQPPVALPQQIGVVRGPANAVHGWGKGLAGGRQFDIRVARQVFCEPRNHLYDAVTSVEHRFHPKACKDVMH
jgi:ABC-type polar amino acid transport system ATPase subunit